MDSTPYVLIVNGEFVLTGITEISKMSKSVTIIEPIHPGEILSEEFLEPMKVSANRLANHIGVPSSRITAIIKGQRSITGDTALRFSSAFGTTAEFWINLQSHYDLECAKDNTEINFGSIDERAA